MAANLTREDLIGKQLELVHETKIENYRLNENGLALASIGLKGEYVTAPAYYWKIEGGRLVITLNRGRKKKAEVVRSLELVEREGDILKLRERDGAVKIFKMTALKTPM